MIQIRRIQRSAQERDGAQELVAAIRSRRGDITSLSLDLGVRADFSRGSLPAQSSPGGAFAPARTFAALSDVIAWNSLSPRAGIAWTVPYAHGLVLRGAYFRLYAPLAGRYLDFGNANSLGGSVHDWKGLNSGSLLLRFGGPYSSISPALRRPDSDEFDIGAQLPLTPRSFAGIHLFRRDDRNRLAASDSGVPAQAFTPVSILDPGPDGISGTFDDQRLTVYAQNPATLGQDRYLLTNPAGLRTLSDGVVAEAGTEWQRLTVHASFVAEKPYGPTNPGDAVYENDPGVVGSLFLDPNTAIDAGGRSFVDRAYMGKIHLPVAVGDAYRFAKLACDLVEKHGFISHRARVQYAMGTVSFWTQPIATAIDFMRSTARSAIETGDLTYVCYGMLLSITALFLRNDPLDVVWRESEMALDFAIKAKFVDAADNIRSQQRFIANMQGRTATFSTFSDEQFDEAMFEARLICERFSVIR
jgi:hypothetical protein